MRLVHRTNYWGDTITSANRDAEVDMDAIWVQVVKKRACCHGFGERSVRVTIEDLKKHYDGVWNLFFVSETEGRNTDHLFLKIVLIPNGTRNYGKEKCKKDYGWSFSGKWLSTKESAESDLKDLLELVSCQHEGMHPRLHVHLGIHMGSCFAGKGNSY